MLYFYCCESAGRGERDARLERAFEDCNARRGVRAVFRAARDARGRPFFPDAPELCVSISHSGRRWGCLIGDASAGSVGLDMEDLARRGLGSATPGEGILSARGDFAARYVATARRFFAEDERRYVEGGADARARAERFFDIWTRKEAYVKYTGRGFGEGFSRFSVLKPDGVRFGRTDAGADVIAAYCVSGAGAPEDTIWL